MSDLSAPGIAVGQEINKYSPDFASIRFSTSTYGKVIAIGWGQFRIASNAIWSSLDATSLVRPGGVNWNGLTSLVAIMLNGVCEGPIAAFGRVWVGQSFYQTIATLSVDPGAQGFLGTYSQNPSSYLPPGSPQELSYRGLAYVAAKQASLALHNGDGATAASLIGLANVNFEVVSATQVGSIAALAKIFTASSPNLNSTGHGFTEFQNIRLTTSGTLPVGLSAGIDYACANVTANAFQLKINPWDAGVVTFTGAGTGTHTATPYFLDANPKDVVVDFLTNVHYGAGFPAVQIAGLTEFFTYCKAAGVFASPTLETPEPGASFLERLATIGYGGMFFSEGLLKIVPYCDTAITGNGVTFTPNVSAVYALTDDDFRPETGDDPVIVERRDPADACNAIKIEFQNRLSQYSTEIVEIRDEASITLYGYRPKDTLTLREIKDPSVAKWVAACLLFREQAVANTYKFRLPAKYLLIEPMDLLTLTESTGTPLSNVPVRITEASEEQDGFISVVAEDFPTGSAIGVSYPNQASNLGYAQNFNIAPGNINAPVMFVAPFVLSAGALELWMGISGGANFGGADIYVSTNNADYRFVGTFRGKSITGVLTADLPQHTDPDNASTLAVNLSESAGTLASVSQAEASLFNSLAYVGGELVSYVNASPGSPNQYSLTALRRGVYGSTPKLAKSGSPVFYIGPNPDRSVFRVAFPAEFNGRLLYFKFLAFNTVGSAVQALSDVSPYLFTLSQQFTGLPPMPMVSGLEIFGQGTNLVFTGRDAKFAWRQSSTERSFDIGSEPFGGNSGGLDPYFKDYEVQVRATPTGAVLRVEHTLDPVYVYTAEKNFEDRAGVPSRSFTVNVYARGQQGQLSVLPASLSVSNPAPAVPSGISVIVGSTTANVQCTLPTDTDVAGLAIWMSTSTGFTPGPGNLVYQGPDSQVTVNGLTPLTQYFFRIAAFDTFGQDQLNTSSEFTATTIFTIGGIQVVTSLPAAGSTGRVVYLTTDGKLYRDNGTIWVKAVDGADLVAATVAAQAMNVAQLSAISADIGDITAGSIRGVNVNASSHTTKGSYLTSAPSGGATTLNVKNTADFAASGSGVIVDTTNDLDDFTYTGKTATTLTGCSGVLAHNNSATIVPGGMTCIVIDSTTNEIRVFGPDGSGSTLQIAVMGQGFTRNFIAYFGSANSTKVGVSGESNTQPGVTGGSNSGSGVQGSSLSGPGVAGVSYSGFGGQFQGNATRGNLLLADSNGATFPTDKTTGQLAQVGGRLYYSDGSRWLPLTMPYFESSEQTITNGTVISVAHGLTDGAGNNRTPTLVECIARCKTAEFGWSVGDEIKVGATIDTGGTALPEFGVFANATNVGIAHGNTIIADHTTPGTRQSITNGNWKFVFRAW